METPIRFKSTFKFSQMKENLELVYLTKKSSQEFIPEREVLPVELSKYITPDPIMVYPQVNVKMCELV